jgi:hypothetical protein
MDPLSITTACLTLFAAVGNTSLAITSFIRSCRDARADLTALSGELTQLHLVLDLLKDDTAISDSNSIIPASLQRQVLSIISNTAAVVESINSLLTQHSKSGKAGVIKWVAFGKGEAAGLRMSLEAHRGSLSLVLELVQLSMARTVVEDVRGVRGDVADIKQDTSQIPGIMAELARLREIVAMDHGAEEQGQGREGAGRAYVLEQYLDSLTSYAESVCNDAVWESEDGATNGGESGGVSRRGSRGSLGWRGEGEGGNGGSSMRLGKAGRGSSETDLEALIEALHSKGQLDMLLASLGYKPSPPPASVLLLKPPSAPGSSPAVANTTESGSSETVKDSDLRCV